MIADVPGTVRENVRGLVSDWAGGLGWFFLMVPRPTWKPTSPDWPRTV